MTRRRATVSRVALQGLAVCGLVLTGWVCQAGVLIQSDTLLRMYEREDQRGGKEKTLMPGYEYLQVDLGALDQDGISFHGYGWGRLNMGEKGQVADDSRERAKGEVMYGYLEYYRSAYKAFARLGRQNIFGGTSNLALDGVRVGSDLTSYFSADAWIGQAVPLESVNGRSEDLAWGGRLEHHYKTLYTIGVGYKRIEDDDNKMQEVLAIDSSFRPPAPVTVTGYSARNLLREHWQEHSYDARLTFKQFRFGALYRYYDLGAYADRGTFNAPALTPERLIRDDERVRLRQWGGDLVARPYKQLELGVRYIRTDRDNDEEDDNNKADRITALATVHAEGLSQVGVEFGRQKGRDDETTYWLARGFAYWQLGTGFLSGDLVYAKYDQEVFGDDSSFFASLGGGKRFMKDALEVRLSGDYSNDPFFDSEVRGILAVSYKFSR